MPPAPRAVTIKDGKSSLLAAHNFERIHLPRRSFGEGGPILRLLQRPSGADRRRVIRWERPQRPDYRGTKAAPTFNFSFCIEPLKSALFYP